MTTNVGGLNFIAIDHQCCELLLRSLTLMHCDMVQKMQQNRNVWALRCFIARSFCSLEVLGTTLAAPYYFQIDPHCSNSWKSL